MADDEKPASIWKKEISFRRKPADEAADVPAASGSSSIWKKEISLRKKDAEHEPMPELDPELAEPVEPEPDLDAAIAALSLPAYVWTLIARAPGFWIELWGRLGWAEYAAAPAWYAALLMACLACAASAVIRRDVDGGLTRHALVVSATYEAAVIWAEYANHAVVGLYAQGRYFVPAAFALAPVLGRPGAARRLSGVQPGEQCAFASNPCLSHAAKHTHDPEGLA